MSDSIASRGQPSSSSYATAEHDPEHADMDNNFATHAITAFSSLIENFQVQVNELKTSQGDTLNELEAIKNSHQKNLTAIDGLAVRVTQCEGEVQDLRQSNVDTNSELNGVRTQTSKLQDAVDEVLKQHNVLTARVQLLSQRQPGVTANVTQVPARPDAVHHTLARGQTQRSDLVGVSADLLDVGADVDDNETRACDCGVQGQHTVDAHTRALSARRSTMGPPSVRNVRRTQPVLSSSTLRGDDPAEEQHLSNDELPPAVATANTSTAPLRKKRKRSTAHQAIEPGEVEPEEELHANQNTRVAKEQKIETERVVSHTDRPIGLPSQDTEMADAVSDVSLDSEEIMVAVRKPKRARIQEKTDAPGTVSLRKPAPKSRPGLVVLATPPAALQKIVGLLSSDSPDEENLDVVHQQWEMRKEVKGGGKDGKGGKGNRIAGTESTAAVAEEELQYDGKRRSLRPLKPSAKKR